MSLAATEIGPSDGRLLLFLHGGGQTRHSWIPACRRFASAGYRCIAYDLRGHGDSSWSKALDYGVGAHANDVEDVMSSLSGSPCLIGASLGGLASLIVTARNARIGALVLVDVTPRIEQRGADEIREFMTARPDGFESVEDAAAAVAAYQPHRSRPVDPKGLLKNLRERGGRLYWHWDPGIVHARSRPDLSLLHEKLRDAARSVRCPTLLVRGGQSRVVSLDGAQELLALIPHARLVNIAKAGHMVAGDDNAVFCEPVLDFLQADARLPD